MKNSTKRSLIMSLLSMALCVSMLIGTTFAWFTDTVTSEGNIIKSGKLDAELLYRTSLNEDWADASKGQIFNYEYWEPGYVDAKYVQVKNVGNLAFKYRLDIIPVENESVEGQAGDVNLADVIDVYVVFEPKSELTREAVADMSKVGTLSELMADPDGAAYGILLPVDVSSDVELSDEDAAIAVEGSVALGIALKMQETAGNEYQGLSVSDTFKVQLTATQYTWEKDSFDNKYDVDLEVLEEGDLLAEEDGIQYIYKADSNEKILYLVPEEYSKDTVNIPEGVTALGNYAFYYNDNVKKVNVPSTVMDLGRSFDSSKVETVNLSEGLTTISNRAFRKTSNLQSVNIPSTVETIEESAFQESGITDITVPASVTSIEKAAFGYCPNLKTITVMGNPVIANNAARACASLETVNLVGENVTFSGTSMAFSNAESGKSEKITIFVANVEVEAGVKDANGSCTGYAVVTTVVDGLAKDAAGEFYVANEAGLSYLNQNWETVVKQNAVINLTSDIDFTGYTWTTVDSHVDSGHSLKELNGNGHTISNLTINGQAMFRRFAGSGDVTIKDITFDNANVNSNGNINTSILTVQSYQNVLLENVDVINSTITGGYKVAPLIATVYNESSSTITATLKNCDVTNCTVKATVYDFCTTGMVAFVNAGDNDKVVFEDCTVSDVTLIAPEDSYKAHAYVYATGDTGLFNEVEGVTVTNCTFEKLQ